MNKNILNKKGFTLVELIIVIAVMAILAAIVIPRMSGITTTFKEKADERVAAQIAREVQVMIQTGVITDTAATTADDVTTEYSSNGGDTAPDLQAASLPLTVELLLVENGAGTADDERFIIINYDGDESIRLEYIGEIK